MWRFFVPISYKSLQKTFMEDLISSQSQLNNSNNIALNRDLIPVVISQKLLDEFKTIIEEDYKVKLSDKAVKGTATFLVGYINLLKKVEDSK